MLQCNHHHPYTSWYQSILYVRQVTLLVHSWYTSGTLLVRYGHSWYTPGTLPVRSGHFWYTSRYDRSRWIASTNNEAFMAVLPTGSYWKENTVHCCNESLFRPPGIYSKNQAFNRGNNQEWMSEMLNVVIWNNPSPGAIILSYIFHCQK